jgi:hypothetical protein
MTAWSSRQVTAVLAMVGAVVAAVGNAIAPRINGDDVVVYHKIAGSTRFAAAGVIVLAATLIVTAAFVGLTRRSSASGTEIALYARLAAVVGGAIAILQTGLELYGYRQQAKAFDGANAHNIVSAFWATNALDHISSALFATWTLVLLGVAPVLIGVMQRRTDSVARLGFAAIVGGLVCCVVGIASLLTADQSTYDVAFGIGSAIVTVWLFVTGLVMWRRTDAEQIDLTEQRVGETTERVTTA